MDDIFLTADPTPTVCPYRITQVYYVDIPRLSGERRRTGDRRLGQTKKKHDHVVFFLFDCVICRATTDDSRQRRMIT